jgi:hypothetical protein
MRRRQGNPQPSGRRQTKHADRTGSKTCWICGSANEQPGRFRADDRHIAFAGGEDKVVEIAMQMSRATQGIATATNRKHRFATSSVVGERTSVGERLHRKKPCNFRT